MDCYGNVGILQTIILGTLDRLGIEQAEPHLTAVGDLDALEHSELFYAEELNPLYQEFARRVAGGFRTRQNATGIYAHAMAVILLSASDNELVHGVTLETIFSVAHKREPRIQKGNLNVALSRLESMQVDKDGRGLVFAYNEATREISVVDRQILLLYRKYSTVKWPWEQLIQEAEERGEAFTES